MKRIMLKMSLHSNNEFVSNSGIIIVKTGTKYIISTRVIHEKGEPFCAYFGVVFLDKDSKEVGRRIRWLNDAVGTEQTVNIISKALTDRIVVIYRINSETPLTSECKYRLLPMSDISIVEADNELEENFEDVNDYALSRPEELDDEQESIFERNIVWIFGSARSGTTWLGTELLSYNTRTVDELRIADHLGSTLLMETGGSPVRRLDHHSRRPSYFFSKRYENTWIYFLRKLFLNRIYSEISDFSHKIIIKEPMGIGAPDIISKCMPQSKIIILLRDGRDIIDSLFDSRRDENSWGVKMGFTSLDQNKRLEFVERQARTWIKLVEVLMKAYDNHPSELRMIIKYEDLRQNTILVLQKTYEFLQIEIKKNELENIVKKYSFENIPSELKGQGKFRRFASPGKWKDNFNDEEKSTIEKIMGSTLKKLGY